MKKTIELLRSKNDELSDDAADILERVEILTSALCSIESGIFGAVAALEARNALGEWMEKNKWEHTND